MKNRGKSKRIKREISVLNALLSFFFIVLKVFKKKRIRIF